VTCGGSASALHVDPACPDSQSDYRDENNQADMVISFPKAFSAYASSGSSGKFEY
jgi:hypothetical protein